MMRDPNRSNPGKVKPGYRRVFFRLAIITLGILGVIMPIRAMVRGTRDRDGGIFVDSRFSSYYSAQGGQEIFGDPISEAFVEVETEKVVQYFENARLELDKDSSGGMVVRTSPLGMMLGNWEVPLTYNGEEEGCRFFQETGHQVCHAFLEYFEINGGAEVFGDPISEFKIAEGRMVQYFQWFRLDWFPDELDQPVKPGPLGRLHLSSIKPELFKSDIEPTGGVEELIVNSSVQQASTTTSGSQAVYILVKDQSENAIEGAAATLIAHFPDGARMIIMPLTDNQGRSQVSFEFENQPAGQNISLEISVVYKGRMKQVRDSFMIHLSGGQ